MEALASILLGASFEGDSHLAFAPVLVLWIAFQNHDEVLAFVPDMFHISFIAYEAGDLLTPTSAERSIQSSQPRRRILNSFMLPAVAKYGRGR